MSESRKFIFSDTSIEKLVPEDKMYRVWDSKLSGFGCRVLSTGRKVFFYNYYNPLKKVTQNITIGKYGAVSCVGARKIAAEKASKVMSGIDVVEEKRGKKKEEKLNISYRAFFEIFKERYIKEHWNATTCKYAKTNINYTLSFFGNMKIKDITRSTVLKFETYLRNKGCGQSVFPRTCTAVLKPLFSFAEFLEYIPRGHNPCYGFKRHKSKKIGKAMSSEEMKYFAKKLEEFPEGNPQLKAAIFLYFYCGYRKTELLKTKWSDLEKDFIYFKESKTGEKVLPLHEKAKEIFDSIPVEGEYIFFNKRTGTHIKSLDKYWYGFKRYAGIKMRLHDLRHNFITHALRETDNVVIASKLAGHKDIKTTLRYIHLNAGGDLKKGMGRVGGIFEK